jgi:putative phage-type endonuclease
MEQRTDEWFQARLGKVTASRIADVMAKTKTGYGATRAKYMDQLVDEIITGRPTIGFSNAAMQHGIDTEPKARAAYELITGNEVVEVGFCPHPTIKQAGASPDGLVGDDGMLEIKCPNTSTHRSFLVSGKIDRRYMLQMQWQMACCDRQWCDFVSFDDRLIDGSKHCKIVEVGRDQELIDEIESEVNAFLDEVSDQLKKYQEST